MDTIVKALIKFYQKLGGTPSDLRLNATAADVIDAISDTYTDKEGTHVEVSTELSEGTKIATITTNNTEHDIYAPAGGGSDVEVFEMITNPNDPKQRIFNTGTSFTDVYNAIEAGKAVIIKCPGVNASSTCYLSLTNVDVVTIAHRTTYYFTTVTGNKYIQLKFVKVTSAMPTYGDFEYGTITVTN